MARGHMIEICTDAGCIGNLSEDGLYGSLEAIGAESADDALEEAADYIREIFIGQMYLCGAETGKTENGTPWFVPSLAMKENFFKGRFAKVREAAAGISLEEFSTDSDAVWRLTHFVCDTFGDCAYDDDGCWHYMDTFLRKTEEGRKYFLGNVVLLR